MVFLERQWSSDLHTDLKAGVRLSKRGNSSYSYKAINDKDQYKQSALLCLAR